MREGPNIADDARRGYRVLLEEADKALHRGAPSEAVDLARRACEVEGGGFASVRPLSGILGAAGLTAEAIDVGCDAIKLRPGDAETRLHVGGLLISAFRWAEAELHLKVHVSLPDARATGWRLLSTVMEASGDRSCAIEAVRSAAALDPNAVEYRLHIASLLIADSRQSEALADLADAKVRFPGDSRVWRVSSGCYEALGELELAISDADVALSLAPRNAEFLAHRRGMAGALAPRSVPPRVTRPSRVARVVRVPGVGDRLRIIYALMLREIRTRFARARLGYAWAILEPISHLLTLGSVFSYMNSSLPPVGDSLFLFYMTGLLPYLMFGHVANEVGSSITSSGAVLQLPTVQRTDVIVSRAALQMATEILVGASAFGFSWLIGLTDRPMFANPLMCVAALLLLWCLGLGIGCINIALSGFFHGWDMLWQSIVRFLYFSSGIYYSPISMPEVIRDALSWNPILHGLDMFRAGFYSQYDPHWLDVGYLVGWSAGTMMVGLALERATRSRIKVAT